AAAAPNVRRVGRGGPCLRVFTAVHPISVARASPGRGVLRTGARAEATPWRATVPNSTPALADVLCPSRCADPTAWSPTGSELPLVGDHAAPCRGDRPGAATAIGRPGPPRPAGR